MKLLLSIIPIKDDSFVVGSLGHISIISSITDPNINLDQVKQQNQIKTIIARYEEFEGKDIDSNVKKRVDEEIEKFRRICE